MKLEQQVFNDNYDFKAFEEILNCLDHIKPIKISRQEYNQKKWNIIEKQSWLYNNLYLPEDLKIYELPAIISRVNKLTFWDKLPEYASKNELKIKIILTIDKLLELYNQKSDQEKKDVERAVVKYLSLYSQMFPEEDSSLLNNKEYRERVIESRNREKYKEYETRLLRINTEERLSNLLEEVESDISEEIIWHFHEVFFEEWVNLLRTWMMTFTREEKTKLKNKKWKIMLHDEELDIHERLLREKIWIDELIIVLTNARKRWIQWTIEILEYFITNSILEIIHKYPYQVTKDWFWFKPNKILDTKEVQCVWYSLLWHSFLSELWIKHYWISLPGHMALDVEIWWKHYYFDWSVSKQIWEFKYWKSFWWYKEIIFIDTVSNKQLTGKSWDAEAILLGIIINNKWNEFLTDNKLNEALRLFNETLRLLPERAESHYTKWDILFELGRYNEAIIEYNIAIKIGWNLPWIYHNRRKALSMLKKYKETTKK